MKWSIKLGVVAGIGIYLHGTFLIFLVWLAVSFWLQARDLFVVLHGVSFIVLLFVCILLHELGHALAARRYGIKTRDITLLPIGGVARLEKMPDDPRQELWVAAAGPAVNVVIALALFLWLSLTQSFESIGGFSLGGGNLLAQLMYVNLFLVLFNLLPAFPMDGGRVLRALLAMRMRYDRATHIAAVVGQGMALLFGFIGLLANPFLIFIALFVWIGAAQESGMTQMKFALSGIPVDHAMLTEFHVLSPHDTLDHVVTILLAGTQHDFPVVDQDRVVGILTRSALLAALAAGPRDTPVASVMQTDFQVVDGYEMMDAAFAKLQACACRTLPVVRHGRLIGMVSLENLGEFMMVQSAIGQAGPEQHQLGRRLINA
jgi:Zn-dependent protease/CBS domain-containing protein